VASSLNIVTYFYLFNQFKLLIDNYQFLKSQEGLKIANPVILLT